MRKFLENHPAAAAAILMAITLAPLMAMRDFTPANELRYLNIVDEAIADGHFFTFTNQGEPYADKPPLYFWLMMLLKTVFGGHSMFSLSLLSFIPATVIIAVMDRWMLSVYGSRYRDDSFTGFAAAMMLGTSALFLGTSVFLRMDMLMCMFIVLSLYSFYKMYTGKGNVRAQSFLLPVYIFMALFTKGPVGLLVPPVAIIVFLAWEGKIKDTGRYLGLKTWGILALLCAVWFTGVWIEGGWPYLENLLFHQTVDRAVDAFHHKEPFWYYMTVIWYILAPYSLLLIPVFFTGLGRGTRDSGDFQARSTHRLYVSVVACTFVMLSAFSSKLSIYLLPVFPFMVYLLPLLTGKFRWRAWHTAFLVIPAVIFFLAGTGGIVILSMRLVPETGSYPFVRSPFVYTALAVLAAGGAASAAAALKSRSWQLPVISLSVSMLLCVAAASPVIPQANDYIGYRNLCRAAEAVSADLPEGRKYVTLSVFRPENMDVYLHEDVMDFGKNVSSYLDSDLGPHVLIVKSAFAGKDPVLNGRLQGNVPLQAGEYSVYPMTGTQALRP